MVTNQTNATQFTPEGYTKWLNQLSEIKTQILETFKTSSVKDCLYEAIVEIENHLNDAASDVCEILKQQSLNDNYYYHTTDKPTTDHR